MAAGKLDKIKHLLYMSEIIKINNLPANVIRTHHCALAYLQSIASQCV